MSLIDLYISDGGRVRRIGDNCHDMLTIEDGKLCYCNLQNGEGCRLGEDGEWYRFVDNVDEYGYNCDPRKTKSCSEKPNNCEHITEDGVTCAKYPACDDCLDNPLNKVKGSERLVKGSEQTEPTISKMEQVEPQTCSFSDCDNFKNPDYERCIECKRKQIKLKTEQTERSSE